ncbi:M20 metallopeptidase family protein [Alkalicoccobacillus murimartini]|uniref:Amidohydrolase n=1 Tax=Alkalicoccobacillus murimartini TaxID=171685 RepID=A0ABT9YKH5_9BACI|nr:M20 family metallopeptidase [Alkalicoccobacillus murimartini]MDQ0208241.1 amidohydrolase [Alkalicoccobacillus murimartini]
MSTLLVKKLEDEKEQVISWRRFLHQNPELSFQETKTAAYIAETLRSFDLEVKTNVGGNGILAYVKGDQEGPTIALRADFDALPIHELNDVPYRSTVDGVMHACGHDGHTSALLGVAKVLASEKKRLKGTVVLIFQHAEELLPGGAKSMIEAGALQGVDKVFGAHVSSDIPLGKVAIREGAVMAAADSFSITIQGKGGHGAKPHTTVDSIVVGSQLVNYLQQIVSRRVNPIDPAVVTVGVFQAGTAFNVIADTAKIEGTVRTYNPDTRVFIEQEMNDIVSGLCQASHAEYTMNYTKGYPAVVNDAAETATVREIASTHLGADVPIIVNPSLGGEDFAYYLEQRPGVFFHVGGRTEDSSTQFPHHHPRFDFNEEALHNIGKMFLAIVDEYVGFTE